MFRPLLVIAAGVLLASGSMISLLLVLPRGTPVTLLSCTVKDQVRECAGHTNPVYLIAFIGFIVGICLPFYGVFGRSFILNPFFMIGILVVALGSFGVIFGYLNAEL